MMKNPNSFIVRVENCYDEVGNMWVQKAIDIAIGNFTWFKQARENLYLRRARIICYVGNPNFLICGVGL